MLGAVMFAHRRVQKVIEAIIKLAEKAAKEPWELAPADDKTAIKAKLKDLIGKDIEAAYKLTDKSERSAALNAARDKAKEAFADADPQEQMVADEAGQEPRGRHRPRRDPQGRPPHRRPRHQDRPPDRGDGRLPAAHPRLGAVHPRRDAGDLHHHAGHQGSPSR